MRLFRSSKSDAEAAGPLVATNKHNKAETSRKSGSRKSKGSVKDVASSQGKGSKSSKSSGKTSSARDSKRSSSRSRKEKKTPAPAKQVKEQSIHRNRRSSQSGRQGGRVGRSPRGQPEDYVRPKTKYADLYEHDHFPAIDRVPTAVGYESGDSADEYRDDDSVTSRYTVDVKSVRSKRLKHLHAAGSYDSETDDKYAQFFGKPPKPVMSDSDESCPVWNSYDEDEGVDWYTDEVPNGKYSKGVLARGFQQGAQTDAIATVKRDPVDDARSEIISIRGQNRRERSPEEANEENNEGQSVKTGLQVPDRYADEMESNDSASEGEETEVKSQVKEESIQKGKKPGKFGSLLQRLRGRRENKELKSKLTKMAKSLADEDEEEEEDEESDRASSVGSGIGLTQTQTLESADIQDDYTAVEESSVQKLEAEVEKASTSLNALKKIRTVEMLELDEYSVSSAEEKSAWPTFSDSLGAAAMTVGFPFAKAMELMTPAEKAKARAVQQEIHIDMDPVELERLRDEGGLVPTTDRDDMSKAELILNDLQDADAIRGEEKYRAWKHQKKSAKKSQQGGVPVVPSKKYGQQVLKHADSEYTHDQSEQRSHQMRQPERAMSTQYSESVNETDKRDHPSDTGNNASDGGNYFGEAPPLVANGRTPSFVMEVSSLALALDGDESAVSRSTASRSRSRRNPGSIAYTISDVTSDGESDDEYFRTEGQSKWVKNKKRAVALSEDENSVVNVAKVASKGILRNPRPPQTNNPASTQEAAAAAPEAVAPTTAPKQVEGSSKVEKKSQKKEKSDKKLSGKEKRSAMLRNITARKAAEKQEKKSEEKKKKGWFKRSKE